MSRSNQYVGLTLDALNYVSKRAISRKTVVLEQGMFDEDILGSEWTLPAPEGPNKALILREKVQIAPWSSGPMFFTFLESILVKECGQEVDMGEYFQWVCNPELGEEHIEYDQVKGHYYV
jgi:hypothetical protein